MYLNSINNINNINIINIINITNIINNINIINNTHNIHNISSISHYLNISTSHFVAISFRRYLLSLLSPILPHIFMLPSCQC